MKILLVHSGNHEQVAPFVIEQGKALREAGCDVRFFAVEGHGVHGYLNNMSLIKDAIATFRPDIVHAHYGLCGLLCTLQHKVPVVVTYHGSDINKRETRLLSKLAMHHAAYNIFVSQKLMQKAGNPRHATVIPCGVDMRTFHPMQQSEALSTLNNCGHCLLINNQHNQHYIIFAGSFDNAVKNPQLAKEACALVPDATLMELKGYNRDEVAALMNVADALLMTSHNEGSPQVVKEAIACGLPVVSVNVGDVEEMIGDEGGYIVRENTPENIAIRISELITNRRRTEVKNTDKIDNVRIARRLITLYENVIHG